MTEPLPTLADTHGLWQRYWLRTPELEDHTTRVMWMQGEHHHVDMRLPLAAMSLDQAPSLSSLSAEQLRVLARAEGFAGTTSVENGICTWTRIINLQGPLKGIDTGRIIQTAEGLLEVGIHDPYEELWQRVDTTIPQTRLMTNASGQRLFLLWTTTRFAMGLGWKDRTGQSRSLPDEVDHAIACGDNTALADAFDQEFCIGRIEDNQGIIEHSTLPMRCGMRAFDASPLSDSAMPIRVARTDFFGRTVEQEYRDSVMAP